MEKMKYQDFWPGYWYLGESWKAKWWGWSTRGGDEENIDETIIVFLYNYWNWIIGRMFLIF